MKLALEIPTSQLERWAPMVDLDFVIAHKVLADDVYAKFFRLRKAGRELILDNSTHEFGKPLPYKDLERAAHLCDANYVIVPDIIPDVTHGAEPLSKGQYRQNLEWLKEASDELALYSIAGVLCGTTSQERAEYTHTALGRADMICFTFHEPNRLEWWREFTMSPYFQNWERIHILGVSTLDELKRWVDISEVYRHKSFSVDTTKPIKWGAQMMRIDKLDSLRGGSIDAKRVLELEEWSEEQIQCVEENIKILKVICQGGK